MVQLVKPKIEQVQPKSKGGMKAVVILSGGVDSTTLLYDLLSQGFEIYPITFHYGQRHNREIDSAYRICQVLGLSYKLVDIEVLGGLAPSALTRDSISVPKVGYDKESMKDTVVPNRNMVFISLATAYAIGLGVDYIFMGTHGGDHALYPDCTPFFLEKMKDAVGVCYYRAVYLEVPYMYWSKVDIIREGLYLGVNYSLTWSCYEGGDLACGKCGTCVERLEAFRLLGVEDPIEYVSEVDNR